MILLYKYFMSHIYYKIYVHLIWTTKNKEPIIDQKIEEFLKKYLPQKIKNLRCEQLALNMTNDHLHLLVRLTPSISISNFVNRIKGASSHEINLNFPNNDFYWQNGYGVLSLGGKAISFVKKYIDNQKEHHKKDSIISTMECSEV